MYKHSKVKRMLVLMIKSNKNFKFWWIKIIQLLKFIKKFIKILKILQKKKWMICKIYIQGSIIIEMRIEWPINYQQGGLIQDKLKSKIIFSIQQTSLILKMIYITKNIKYNNTLWDKTFKLTKQPLKCYIDR